MEALFFKRILWAIDPIPKNKHLQETAARLLKALSLGMNFSIQPISVLLEDQLPYLLGRRYNTDEFSSNLVESLKKWLLPLQLRNLEPPKILIEKEFSWKKGVEKLLKFAEENHFDLIVATTHAKNRNGHPDLGTFSETLFLQSGVPLLLLSPKARIPTRYTEILYPTDLSVQSLRALNYIEPIAKSLKAHITLFHKIFSFTKEIVEFPYSTDARSNFIEQLHYDQQGELESLTNRLKQKGIPASFVIDRIEADYTSQAITYRAERLKDCFIAMASHTGNDLPSMPGSITRQVIRNTLVPVLVLHPQKIPS